MGDGWEIENSSSEKVQSLQSKTRSHCASQMRKDEGDSKGLSKFDLDLKSLRRFSECNDIAQSGAISFADSNTASSLQDVKQHPTHREEHDISSRCAFVRNPSANAQDNIPESVQQIKTVLDGDPGNCEANMETETLSESIFPALKSFSLEENGKTKENILTKESDFKENDPKDFNDFNEGKTCYKAVITAKEETISSKACGEEHISTDSNSGVQNKPRMQEKENSKRRLSFRALVRMKGLGRRIKKKHQITKKREKFVNSRNESGQEFKSTSSTKYLLESSTSTSEEQTVTHVRMTRQKEQEKCHQHPNSLKGSESFNNGIYTVVQNLNEYSSSEDLCSLETLERRRGAVCEELEKTQFCGEQTVAKLRAILVVQQKLTGFGLL